MAFAFSESDVVEQIAGNPTNKVGSLKAPGQAQVRFRLHAALDGDATLKRGFNCYREAVYFSRRDRDRGREDGVDRIATEDDFREHPEAYRAYLEWIRDPQFPVGILPYISPAVLRLLEDGSINTVQELAFAKDLTFRDYEDRITKTVPIESVPELVEPRKLARHWLTLRPESQKPPETETERLRRELAEANAKLAKPPTRKPGRPPKSKNDAQNVQATAGSG